MICLPFEVKPCTGDCGTECGKKLDKCPMYKELSAELQEECQQNLHLLQYLYSIPKEGLGTPEYHLQLGRALKSLKVRNLIYPVGGGVYIHVLANEMDIRDHYIAIEPGLFENMDGMLGNVEDSLADFVEELEDIDDETKRVEAILGLVDRLVTVRGGGSKPASQKKNGGRLSALMGGSKGKEKIKVSLIQYNSLKYLLKRKLVGLGVLEPMIRDNNIEDISCSGLGNIFVEHKVFGGLKATIGFETNVELDKFVIQLAEGIKHPVTFRDPCVDATLPDGSRINIVYGIDVSKRGSNFTIRKFSPTPMSILEMIDTGSLNYEMAAYLSICLQENMNLWVSGETASGKTTLMNALTTFVPPESKIVSIEDTPEVQVPHPNWIRGCTRESSSSSESSSVTMFDLLKAALRQRPNMIIVGEIRGEEGAIAFQGMQTGHACMSTFHAATVTKLIQRLTGNPINIPKSYVDNLNLVVIAQQVRLPNGKSGRRTTSINEIISYDSISDSFSFLEAFVWDPVTDTHYFKGHMNSYLLEYKIAPKRGLSEDKRRQIYTMLKQRAGILKRMREQEITNFYDLHGVLSKAYRDGHFR